MLKIHFVERLGNVHLIDRDRNEWESGYWAVSEDTAERLIGGDLFLHTGQTEASHFGGSIIGFRVHHGGDLNGRIVFRIQASMAHKGVKTDREGWGNEKKIVEVDQQR